jgi:DNA-3-methyladenine glycosylase
MLYHDGGTIFVYLCYGMYWMLNIVTGAENDPQGVLIRACEAPPGREGSPGRWTSTAPSTASTSWQIRVCGWSCRSGKVNITCDKRVGIDYAAPADRDRLWRFIMEKRE